jgi:hypothetical protein
MANRENTYFPLGWKKAPRVLILKIIKLYLGVALLLMKLNKRQSYFALLAIWFLLCLLYQSLWIFSRTATAKIVGVETWNHARGYGSVYGRNSRSGITVMDGTYSVDGRTYNGYYLKDGYDIGKQYFEVRYLLFDPGISRSNTFASNWGPLIMLFILLSLVTSIVYVRKDIFSDQATLLIQRKRPFVRLINNQIEDYDEHVIENKNPDEAEQALKTTLQNEAGLLQQADISTSVYKFNPNAIGIFVGYIFFFCWVFYSLLTGSLGSFGIVFFGALLLFIPLYVQNTNNPIFKAKIPDEGSLIFSSRGVQFKDAFYSVENITAAVVYLESFRGFKYRDRVSTGKINSASVGDNNKISYRCEEEVMDFTFILDQATDYWSFKNLMTRWSEKGVNVILQKVFEDDFVIQEMVHFHTPVTA